MLVVAQDSYLNVDNLIIKGVGDITLPKEATPSSKDRLVEAQYALKGVMCGDWAVGKSSLVRRFTEDKFDHDYKPSIGVNVTVKTIDIEGKILKLQLFDTGGQERFQTLRQRYYQGAHAVIFVFDTTRASSAVSIESRWLPEVQGILESDFERLVLGNKVDLETDREVSEYAARQSAERVGATYYETSALTGNNVQVAFVDLANRLVEKLSSKV